MGSRKRKKPKRKDSRTARERTLPLSRNGKRAKNTRNDPIEAHDDTEPGTRLRIASTPKPRGRGDSGLILTDPHRQRSDIAMVERAVQKGWLVRRKQMIRRRLEDIVEKEEADVITKQGVVYSASAADDLAIKAAKVLVAMDGQDQARVAEANKAPPPPMIGIHVNGNANIGTVQEGKVDERRSKLLGLLERLGVGEGPNGEDTEGVLESGNSPTGSVSGGAGQAEEPQPDSKPTTDETSPEADDVPELDLRGSFVRRRSGGRQD